MSALSKSTILKTTILKSMNLKTTILVTAVACAVGTACVSPNRAQGAADPSQSLKDRAEVAYEAGRCSEVLTLYAQLMTSAPEEFDGVSSYRLAFCSQRVQRADPTEEYRRAADLLSGEVEMSGAPLNSHFYLVNARLNLNEQEQAVAAAKSAVAKFEQGKLTIPQDDAQSWFRLGKLYRDAGDVKGAMKPYRRALDASEKSGATMRSEYLERIAAAALEAGDQKLAKRAASIVESEITGDSPEDLMRLGRAKLIAGDYDGAFEAFRGARTGRGDSSMNAQYSMTALTRVEELQKWGLKPSTSVGGTVLSELDNSGLQAEFTKARGEIAAAIERAKLTDAPKKKGNGTRRVLTAASRKELQQLQADFTGLLIEAVRRGVPIREWAVAGSFAPLVYSQIPKLAQRQLKHAEAEAADQKASKAEAAKKK